MSMVGVIGAGYVGKATGTYFKERGHEVLFYDINESVVQDLRNNGFVATEEIKDIARSRYIFVSVPTPTRDDGVQVLDHIIDAVTNLAKVLKDTGDEHVIVIKSTILPGTMEKSLIPIFEQNCDINKIGVLYSPEFLTEIHTTWTKDREFKITPENEYRIVIGESSNKKWGDMIVRDLYSDVNIPIIRTDYKTAEMIKYASNNALAARISYWNEIFLVCKELGIDSNTVAQAAALDPRIGKYGTVHGKAFGGKCLPKDLAAFIRFAGEYRDVPLHRAVKRVNDEMKEKYGVRE